MSLTYADLDEALTTACKDRDAIIEDLRAAIAERDEARANYADASRILGAALIEASLAPGESLADAPQHAVVNAVRRLRLEAEVAQGVAKTRRNEMEAIAAELADLRAHLLTLADTAEGFVLEKTRPAMYDYDGEPARVLRACAEARRVAGGGP